MVTRVNRPILTLTVNNNQEAVNEEEFNQVDGQEAKEHEPEPKIRLDANIINVNYGIQETEDDASRNSREHTPKSVNTVTQINLHFNTPCHQ